MPPQRPPGGVRGVDRPAEEASDLFFSFIFFSFGYSLMRVTPFPGLQEGMFSEWNMFFLGMQLSSSTASVLASFGGGQIPESKTLAIILL